MTDRREHPDHVLVGTYATGNRSQVPGDRQSQILVANLGGASEHSLSPVTCYLLPVSESADVETSAPDRRLDHVRPTLPPARVMRPTYGTEAIVTSAIDLRDDVVRDEPPSIVGDACHGSMLDDVTDGVVSAIEQDDTRPLRRFASGTTPPAMHDEHGDDPLTMTLARGSSPAIDAPIGRGSSPAIITSRGDG